MKKFWLSVLILLTCLCLAFSLTGCRKESIDGTYYLFVDGEKQEDSYVKLDGEKWEYADGENGTFTLKGSTITFWGEAFGMKVEMFSGTVEKGVLTLYVSGPDEEPDVYYKEGKSPKSSEEGADGTTASKGFTVTFDTQGGSAVQSQQVKNGQKATRPTDPTRDGYTFDGWYVEGEKWSFVGYVVTENMTLTAKWLANTYTVYFDSQGGSEVIASKQVEFDTLYGEIPTPTKTDYTFDGWYTAINGGTKITANAAVKITQDTQVYARWLRNYTVSFNSEGGTIVQDMQVTQTYPYGELPTPTRAGYSFKGWYTATIDGTKITATDTVQLTQNTTLYAQWQIAAIYTLSNDNAYYTVTGLNDDTVRDLVILDTYKDLPVKEIASAAFYECDNLTSVIISDGIQTIGGWAFGWCINLTSVVIPDSVQMIRDYAFHNCPNLTSVILGNGVQTIGFSAFGGRTNLTSVYYHGTENQWNDISIDGYNSDLTSATRYYYSATPVTGCWHYDTDGVTPVLW